jgi:hypothetical protein
MEQLVVDASTAREHAAQIIERECESPPLNTPVPAPPQPIFSRRGAAVGACQKLPPVLRMGFNSDASDHPQLYQVMQSVDLDFVQAMEEMGCIGTLDLLKVFRSGGIEW